MGVVLSACTSSGEYACPADGLASGLEVVVAVAYLPALPDAARLCIVDDCTGAELTTGEQVLVRRQIPPGTSRSLDVRLQLLAGGTVMLDASGWLPSRTVSSGTGPCRRTATFSQARYDATTRALVRS